MISSLFLTHTRKYIIKRKEVYVDRKMFFEKAELTVIILTNFPHNRKVVETSG